MNITHSPLALQSNYLVFSASTSGYPCDRQLGYEVLKYERDPLSKKTERIFSDGHMHERKALEELKADGIKFRNSVLGTKGQAEFQIEVKLKDRPIFFLLAHPDGAYISGYDEDLEHGSPIEIKGLNRFTWRGIRNPSTIPPRYYIQCQVQMMTMEKGTCLFVVRNKETGEHKRIIVPRNEERIKSLLGRLASISTTIVKYGRMPQASWPPGSKECNRCMFLKKCLSDHGLMEKTKEVGGEKTLGETKDLHITKASHKLFVIKRLLKFLETEEDHLVSYMKNYMGVNKLAGVIAGKIRWDVVPQTFGPIPDPTIIQKLIEKGTIPLVPSPREGQVKLMNKPIEMFEKEELRSIVEHVFTSYKQLSEKGE